MKKLIRCEGSIPRPLAAGLLIAGLAAVLFVFCLSGCDGMLDSSNDGDGLFSAIENHQDDTGGQLTVTNIPSGLYGSYSVYICSYAGLTNPHSNYSASGYVTINSSTEVIDLYGDYGSQWTGSGSYYVYLVRSNDAQIAAKTTGSVYFSDGVAAVNASQFDSGTGGDQGQLTVTNIPSGLYGSYSVYICSYAGLTNPQYNYSASGYVTINSSTEVIDLDGDYGSQWTGSGSYYVYLVDGSNQIAAKTTSSVSFSDGVAAVNASQFDSGTGGNQGRLTVTNISSGLYGSYSVYICSSGSLTNPSSNYSASGNVTINSSTGVIDLYGGSGSQWTGSESYYVYLVDGSNQIAAKTTGLVYFSNGSAEINASQFDSASNGFPPSSSVYLYSDSWTAGSLSDSGQEVWYGFSASDGTTYYVEWNDSYRGDGTKTGDIKVTAYTSSGSILFNQIDSAYSGSDSSPQVISGVSGTIYLKVEGYLSSSTGSYAIKYY
jgi:hypothetical protein